MRKKISCKVCFFKSNIVNLVDSAKIITLVSKYPEVSLLKSELTSCNASSATSFARKMLKKFFNENDLGKVTRGMIETQHPEIMNAIYSN